MIAVVREKISGRRSLALWGLGMMCALHGALYVHIPRVDMLPAGLRLLNEIVPLQVVACGWIVAAVPLLWCAATRRPGWSAAAVAFIMLGVWGTAYLAGVVQSIAAGDGYRSLLLSGTYASIQLIMLSVTPDRQRQREAQTVAEALPQTIAMLNRKSTDGDSE